MLYTNTHSFSSSRKEKTTSVRDQVADDNRLSITVQSGTDSDSDGSDTSPTGSEASSDSESDGDYSDCDFEEEDVETDTEKLQQGKREKKLISSDARMYPVCVG